MKLKSPPRGLNPHEQKGLILPTTISALLILTSLLLDVALSDPVADSTRLRITGLVILGSVFIIAAYVNYIPAQKYHQPYAWGSALLSGIGLGILAMVLSDTALWLFGVLLVLAVTAQAVITERFMAHLVVLISLLIAASTHAAHLTSLVDAIQHLSLPLLAFTLVETVERLKDVTHSHIHRLEVINKISHQITSSLDTSQVLSLLNAAIQSALEADTYFVGLREGDQIKLGLLYDDGEYFQDQQIPVEGTLSGWVVKNHKALFLPDLRRDVDLEGVTVHVIGKAKISLAWLGVPMQSANISGLIAVASYRPDAFDNGDVELLENLAQHAAQALDNTIRHAQVEELTHKDSLTGVFNHGYFLKVLQEQADEASLKWQPLSLIMLDVDHFKQYNDTFGHLAGDQILTTLCAIIRRYTKNTDAIGRWGGEEFAISLPGATGMQALRVAERIRDTMSTLTINGREKENIPAPTVSQGIAIFPDEAGEIFQLIDLADRRLYVAKERGRNQIEPDASHWGRLQMPLNKRASAKPR